VRFLPATLPGAFRIELERREDDRGFFARSWCVREAEEHGLNPRVVQCNVSVNLQRGTLRGMHFQTAPHQEAKLVRCTRGAIVDVIVDLRPDSPTYKRWERFELTARNGAAVYVPEGMAHGFQTLEADTEVLYQMSEFYSEGHASGVRWDDPAFGIEWPIADPILSPRDATYPDFAG
jgi:dTDP-4-dehydrorhamnose 3,5-epimerase